MKVGGILGNGSIQREPQIRELQETEKFGSTHVFHLDLTMDNDDKVTRMRHGCSQELQRRFRQPLLVVLSGFGLIATPHYQGPPLSVSLFRSLVDDILLWFFNPTYLVFIESLSNNDYYDSADTFSTVGAGLTNILFYCCLAVPRMPIQ